MSGNVVDFPGPDLGGVREEARRQQRLAADPANSAWVSANAGTGKTYVLVLRVLRLLLAGAPIESILCLTFTKAAAAEMSNRLIARLGKWAAMPSDALGGELGDILQRAPAPEELAFARCLFAKVLDAPGGLKIMTIHAFCDRVLRRFPLEAGVPPGFAILTEEEQRALLQEASDMVLNEASGDPQGPLGQALVTMVAHAAEERFRDLVKAVASRRDTLARLIREQDGSDPFAGIEAVLRDALGAGRTDTPETILAEQAALAPDSLIARAIPILCEGKKTDKDTADALGIARGKPDAVRVEALAGAFLTKDGKPLADRSFLTKAIQSAHPGIAEELCRARDDFAALEVKRRAIQVCTATAALLRLAHAVIQAYEDAKAQRLAIDFDGLIARAAALFQRSDAAAWVLYRLDASIDHILVDEAQDTSPAQWALIRALTAEFFAGEGVEDRTRTLFAVGDEKQSIYGFQGADPRQFVTAGRDYSARARQARQPWIEAPLALSYRSTSAVLEAVDLVFADKSRAGGLTAEEKPVRHFAHREGEAGLIEIWPVVKAEPRDAAPAWEPFSEGAGGAPPAVTLANRISRQIRYWLDTGETLASLGRPVRPGDILILVRKRAPFAAPMVRALKAHGIPVAGADRMKLTGQLAVMDLMALGDSLLLPEDDLTLAALLKSPVFGLDDDDLFAIGHERDGALWEALREQAGEKPAYADALRCLENWRDAAAREKPFDFYMARLESEGLRERLLARLGPEAADAISEFLNLALAYEGAETPTLQGFLHWLRVADAEIKRDMEGGRDEVRVMTAHGSKGLEANIVILADTCSVRGASSQPLIDLPRKGEARPGSADLPVWLLSGAQLVPAIRETCELAAKAERAEYRRLLYVAMTRARDRLYVAGFEGLRARDKGCWYDLIVDGLEPHLADARDSFGNPVRRMECQQAVAPKEQAAAAAEDRAAPLPAWHAAMASLVRGPIVINPSRLDTGGGHLRAGLALEARARDVALLRGRLTHRLIELLPGLDPAGWEKSAHAFLKAEGKELAAGERAALIADVTAILNHAEFGALFTVSGRAEAPVVAELAPFWEGGPPVVISGQIDRLLRDETGILILDYKTGGAIPETPELTPRPYLVQLAAYRLALARLFPALGVRAALLWTEGPRLMPISPDLIGRGEWLLYESVRSRHLDP